jgi:Uma2 family endonuclease
MATKKGTLTAEELLSLPDDGFRHELVEGRLVTMPPTGWQHGSAVVTLGSLLHAFVRSNGLGIVGAGEPGFILSRNPDTVRAPDVAFVSQGRLPEGELPTGYLPFAPDLVAEVVSPNDRPREVEAKAQAWLRAGVRVVWVVHPGNRTVTIYESGRKARMLSHDEELLGDPVLPGFRCSVGEFFE